MSDRQVFLLVAVICVAGLTCGSFIYLRTRVDIRNPTPPQVVDQHEICNRNQSAAAGRAAELEREVAGLRQIVAKQLAMIMDSTAQEERYLQLVDEYVRRREESFAAHAKSIQSDISTVEKQHRDAMLAAMKQDFEKWKSRGPSTDVYEIPDAVGQSRRVDYFKVLQVIDEKRMLVGRSDMVAVLVGFDTTDVVDGQLFHINDYVTATGTQTYTTVAGGTKKVFTLHPRTTTVPKKK